MKTFLTILALLVSLLLYALPTTTAQTNPACDAAAFEDVIAQFINELEVMRETLDPTTAADKLQELANSANMIRATCDGLAFEDDKQSVVGPVEFPAGVYRATFTTEGYGAVSVNPLSGNCGQGSGSFLTPSLFLIMGGNATEGAESIFSSEECNALIEVSNVQGAWSLTFERLSTG